jgi:hypothetical protein
MFSLSKQRAWPSRLLAFARAAEPRRAPSSTALGIDALLACIAAIASLVPATGRAVAVHAITRHEFSVNDGSGTS